MNRKTISQNLEADEITILLQLYYTKDYDSDGLIKSDTEKEILQRLMEKNLVTTHFGTGKNKVIITDEGLTLCETVIDTRIREQTPAFKQAMHAYPTRAIACLINRVLWRQKTGTTREFLNSYTEPFMLHEDLWYERVLLKDKRITDLLDRLYSVLESLRLIQTIENRPWCSPQVEKFLKNEYKNVHDLSWNEEDSLKYYYFFYIYAHDQKNLIDFTGDAEQYRSLFLEGAYTSDYWYSSNRFNSRNLLSILDISEKRTLNFLQAMQEKNIISERYYPLGTFSFFSDDKIFIIKDIKKYMDVITTQFLTPTVDSLLKK